MKLPNWLTGGLLATIGFILSPLSWWNDLVINLPIAYVAGVMAGFLKDDWFLPGMIVGYWLSNVIGLILMHLSIRFGWGKKDRTITRRDLLKDLYLSIVYTVLIVVLVQAGFLAFPVDQVKEMFSQ